MKKTFLLFAVVVLAVAGAMTSCSGSSALEDAVRSALVQKDTTQARFDSICSIIKGNPREYSAYMTQDGEINIDELGKLIESIGNGLRPPMHWNIAAYGLNNMSLTIYFERSGSMVPYDAPSGRGQLKKAVNDLINYFPYRDNVKINIVNDGIYPYSGTIDSFLQDRNIYASTRGVGNASFTDFGKIFGDVLQANNSRNISVIITDMIYSPADTRDVSADKIFNEENSLATNTFKRNNGKSMAIYQLTGDYNGQYYPYNNQPFQYNGTRPFYIVIVADSKVMDAIATNKDFAQFFNIKDALNSYRFNQGGSEVEWNVLPDWKDNAGRFRIDHGNTAQLNNVEGDRATGTLCFTVAANLDGLGKTDEVLCNPGSYSVTSMSQFAIKVTRITPDMINGNNKAYLEGKTHLITITGDFKGSRDEVKIMLRNDFPQWIAQSTCTDDTSPSLPGFGTTTFGLQHFLRGIYDAFNTGGANYFTIDLTLNR
ncbi:MAG: hypothetical protein KBT10_03130 [Bacteroidales bacterium]|nr:hypothetical protein [Candidatus Sodaliphilus aphodohippi]